MKTYVGLLRGINVGGQKKIKMADLRAMMVKLEFENVQTYIQSGNVVFKSEETCLEKIENKIKMGIADTLGFDVPILVKVSADIKQVLEDNPFTRFENIEANRIYYTLLHKAPEKKSLTNLNPEDYPHELFHIGKNCVYLNCLKGAGKAKLNNNIIERKLGVSATTRNHRTMLKLLKLSEEL